MEECEEKKSVSLIDHIRGKEENYSPAPQAYEGVVRREVPRDKVSLFMVMLTRCHSVPN